MQSHISLGRFCQRGSQQLPLEEQTGGLAVAYSKWVGRVVVLGVKLSLGNDLERKSDTVGALSYNEPSAVGLRVVWTPPEPPPADVELAPELPLPEEPDPVLLLPLELLAEWWLLVL